MLKDDKTYPYIKIHWQDDFPKVSVTRRVFKDGGGYYGPYTSAFTVRQTLDNLRRVFPYLTCNREITGQDPRACLYYDIKLCVAPCIGVVDREEYRDGDAGPGRFPRRAQRRGHRRPGRTHAQRGPGAPLRARGHVSRPDQAGPAAGGAAADHLRLPGRPGRDRPGQRRGRRRDGLPGLPGAPRQADRPRELRAARTRARTTGPSCWRPSSASSTTRLPSYRPRSCCPCRRPTAR